MAGRRKVSKDEFPQELKRFNWGAFLLNWIWGIMHKQYITLLYFVACIIPVLFKLTSFCPCILFIKFQSVCPCLIIYNFILYVPFLYHICK